jgi:septal ring factor EnvC (AmiA/AmiB activator)
MNRLEIQMDSFDNALAALEAKVDAVIAVIADDEAAVAAAREAVAAAEAKAAAVVADDASQDAAVDAARAGALAGIGAKLDAVLKPAPEPKADLDVPVEPVVDVPVGEVPEVSADDVQ